MLKRKDSKYHKVNKKAVGVWYSVRCLIDGIFLNATFEIDYVLSKKYLTREEVENKAVECFEEAIVSRRKKLTADKKLLKKLKSRNK